MSVSVNPRVMNHGVKTRNKMAHLVTNSNYAHKS